MIRVLFFLLFFVFSFARVEIFATKVKEVNSTIYLTNPLILYDNYYIQAKEGKILNKNTLILKKDVYLYNKTSFIRASYMKATLSKSVTLKDILVYSFDMDVWAKTNSAHIKNNVLEFNQTIISSCCFQNPDWFFRVSSGSYNKKTKYMKLYNVVVYINNVPVFYLPFYFNSLNKERRSGLLRPYIGYSKLDGFLYTQPIYFVLGYRADLEFEPTIRSKRGKGIYSIFRFVDSPSSFGKLKAGYFKDYTSFTDKYDLLKKSHFGIEFNYKRDEFLDGRLYVDLKRVSDIDYFYLDAKNYTFIKHSDRIVTSQANYLLEQNNSVFGIYAKYFQDTSKVNNDDTYQLLPQFNYHYFSNKKNDVVYSFDFNIYNYYIKNGVKYVKSDALLPFGFVFNKKYFNVKTTENIKWNYLKTDSKNIEDSYYAQAYTQVDFFLSFTHTKGFYHLISPRISFIFPNAKKKRVNFNDFTYAEVKKSISFDFYQNFQVDSFNLDHFLKESYQFTQKNRFSDLENTLKLKFYDLYLDEYNKYSNVIKKTVYNSFKIGYNFEKLNLEFLNLYKKDEIRTNVYTLKYKINKYKKFSFQTAYDMINKYYKYYLVSLDHKKKCWNYNLSFRLNRVPRLTDNGVSYLTDKVVSFNIELVPFGGVSQSFDL